MKLPNPAGSADAPTASLFHKRIGNSTLMNKRTWLLVALIGTLGLALVLPKLLPRPKARAQRIQAVNNFPRPFPERAFGLTNVAVRTLPQPKHSRQSTMTLNHRSQRTPRFRSVCISRQWRGVAAAER